MTDAALAGRRVVLTGASRGIGAAIAERLSAAGAHLIRLSRSPMPSLAETDDYRVDLADPASREPVLTEILARHGTPDAVVSNAGSFLLAPLEETSDALLREQLAINLEAPLAIARKFLPGMRARGSGSHLLIGSIADLKAFPDNSAYSASKFGARGLHEVLVEEYCGSGVRCTLISPGPTDTSVWDPVDPDHREGFTPRAQMLRPADVAEAVLFVLTRPPHVQIDLLRLGAT